jgi:DNA-binding MarR family transcriptional regulator
MRKKLSTSGVLEDLYARPGHLLRRCQQIHVGLFLQELARFELTPVQYSSMFVLSSMNGIDQTTLAGLVAIDRSTAGNVLMRLESRGLIKRETSPDDGRARVLLLTPKGKKTVRDAADAVARVQERLLSPLNERERKAFVSALRKIADSHNDVSRAPVRGQKIAALG